MTTTIIHLVEQHGLLTLTIGQEWAGAGIFWRLECPTERARPLPRYYHQSSGRFYPDQNGEILDGATLADVVQTARRAALLFMEGDPKP